MQLLSVIEQLRLLPGSLKICSSYVIKYGQPLDNVEDATWLAKMGPDARSEYRKTANISYNFLRYFFSLWQDLCVKQKTVNFG